MGNPYICTQKLSTVVTNLLQIYTCGNRTGTKDRVELGLARKEGQTMWKNVLSNTNI